MAERQIPAPPAAVRGLVVPESGHGSPAANPPIWVVARRPSNKDVNGALTPQFVLRAILHWFWLIAVAAVLLAAVSSAAILYFGKPVYRASAWIEIEPRARYLVRDGREDADKSEQEQYVNTQVELMRGPLVLGKLVSSPEVARLPEVQGVANPLELIRKRLTIAPIGKSQLYEVAFEGQDGRAAALLVNAVLDSYFALLDDQKITRQQRVIDLLMQQQGLLAKEVTRLRQRMQDLGEQILGKDPFTGTPTAEAFTKQPLAAIHERLLAAEAEAKILEVQAQALEETMQQQAVSVSEAQLQVYVDSCPEIREMDVLLANKRTMLERVESTATLGKQDPSYDRLDREIADYEKSRSKLRETLRPRLLEELKSQAEIRRKDELDRLQNQLGAQRVLEQMLRDRYDQQLKNAGTSGERSLELEFTRNELAQRERIFEIIADRIMTLQTENLAPGRVVPLRRAEAPDEPTKRYPVQYLALAAVLSLVLPVGTAVLWESRIRRINDARQLERLPNLPVLAEVARLPLRHAVAGPKRRGAGRALELYEESIDSLRTCLVLPDARQPLQVLAVTSAVPDEGKTSLATQLVLSIARATRKPTLVIDTDLRSPDVHRIFRLDNEPGLAKLLDGQCPFEAAVNTQWSEWLHVLPAGRLHKSPHELFGNGRFADILREARGRYQHIIIDTPPILAASEALVISKQCDGTLLCAMRGRSREDQVQLAHRRLQSAGSNPLGAVLNAVPTRSYEFAYGKYGYRLDAAE